MRIPSTFPIIGRDEQLDQLLRAVHQARAGRGQAIFLIGEDGVGKSRLAAEVADLALNSGACVAFGHPSVVGQTVLCRPLIEVLLRLLRTGYKPGVNELGPYGGILGRLIPEYSGADTGDTAFSLITLAEAVLRVTALAARDCGCLIVLEDLHDMDADTLAVTEYMVDNLDRQPTVLLATIRADQSKALEVAHNAVRRGSGTVLTLGRLDQAQLREFIGSRLGIAPAEVSDELVSRLWADSVGNPAMADALLSSVISRELLVREQGTWRLVGEPGLEVPGTLVRSIARRADRLGPQGRELLTAAAIFGPRFPLSPVQAVTEMASGDLLHQLDAAMTAGLVHGCGSVADWYEFVHPLLTVGLLRQLTASERVSLARRAAQAVQKLHPALPGDWCELAASLEVTAGNGSRAASLFTEAGTQALADGKISSAVSLLERAYGLLPLAKEPGLWADVLGQLPGALVEAGQADRASRLSDQLDELSDSGLHARRMAALRADFAIAACLAGRWADAAVHAAAARALLGSDPAVDAVEAWLARQDPDRVTQARELAEQAAHGASEADSPATACLAWYLLGILARQRDLPEAAACFEKVGAIAREHRVMVWRLRAQLQLGVNSWLADGDTTRVQRIAGEADELGAVLVRHEADAIITLELTFRGEFSRAADRVHRGLAVPELQPGAAAAPLYLARVVLAAHQGWRHEMDGAIAQLHRTSGERSPLTALAIGLARAYCALLEDDHKQARRELAEAAAVDALCPALYPLAGQHGLQLLLEVVYGDAGWPEYQEASAAVAARLRWNWQFIMIARAVLLGRGQAPSEALTAMSDAAKTAASYPTSWHLGLRLAAEAAIGDRCRWGQPVTWLRQAEEYFHVAGLADQARSCRALLRQMGEPVLPHRHGRDHVPRVLRELGVTVREYEVLQLLPNRPGNKAIAARLYISPRTVEKHVASLICKIGQPDRESLSDFASGLEAA
jgi:DNA-binding CsgD family transcriptional regulator